MKIHRHEYQVGFGECDPAGIVYYPNFFRLFDGNCERLFGAVGLRWSEMFGRPGADDGAGLAGFPIVNTGAEFIEPVSYGQRVTLETSIASWSIKSFRVEHRIVSDGRIMAQGFEVRVWAVRDPARPGRIKGAAIPDHIKALFEQDPV
ncbi:MAG: acyl-CoA thioesterase [Pseudomonadota bacterium]